MAHRLVVVLSALILLSFASGSAQDGMALLSVDHYVRVKSTAPGMAGQTAQIYVREVPKKSRAWSFWRPRTPNGTARRTASASLEQRSLKR